MSHSGIDEEEYEEDDDEEYDEDFKYDVFDVSDISEEEFQRRVYDAITPARSSRGTRWCRASSRSSAAPRPTSPGDVVALVERLGKRARGKTPPGEEPPWSARNFVPFYSQLLSKEVQRGVADEILHRAREEIVAREARQDRG